jgi:hypothetical protein
VCAHIDAALNVYSERATAATGELVPAVLGDVAAYAQARSVALSVLSRRDLSTDTISNPAGALSALLCVVVSTRAAGLTILMVSLSLVQDCPVCDKLLCRRSVQRTRQTAPSLPLRSTAFRHLHPKNILTQFLHHLPACIMRTSGTRTRVRVCMRA